MRRLLTGLVLMSAGWLAQADSSSPEPIELLGKMAEARQELSYEGTFTYEHQSAMASFRMYRWAEDGQVRERLEYLNGPEGAVQQTGNPADCQPTGYSLLNPAATVDEASDLDKHYRLRTRGLDRVAGREAYMVEIRPKDQLRYGYLLGVDRESGLLLKALLIDEQQRLLERFQYVELDLDPDSAKQEAMDGTEKPECDRTERDQPSRWSLNWLPPGFVYSGEKRLSNGIDMLMYTDGLASFSVFLQPVSSGVNVEGHAQRGATSAYMGQLTADNQRYRVTVVGEIPGAVAEQLARGLNFLPKPATGQR